MDTPSLVLLDRYRQFGDQAAARELYFRYADRLVALARAKLPAHLARRVEADDVVQSACRTFFVRVRDGRLDVRPDGSLWQLLAAITVNKVYGQQEHHAAEKRNVRRESEPDPDGSVSMPMTDALAGDPDPAEVTALHELLDHLLVELPLHHRQMVELRLHGFTHPEIAEQTGRGEKTVRNVLNEFNRRLEIEMTR